MGDSELRQLEIRKLDADEPWNEERTNYERSLKVSTFSLEPGAVNVVIDVWDRDTNVGKGVGMNLTVEDLESIMEFVRGNQFPAGESMSHR